MKEKELNKSTKNTSPPFSLAPLLNPFRPPILELTSCFQTTWFFIHPKCRNYKGTFRTSTYS